MKALHQLPGPTHLLIVGDPEAARYVAAAIQRERQALIDFFTVPCWWKGGDPKHDGCSDCGGTGRLLKDDPFGQRRLGFAPIRVKE